MTTQNTPTESITPNLFLNPETSITLENGRKILKTTAPTLTPDEAREMGITRKQVRALDSLRRYVEQEVADRSRYGRAYEIKAWEIQAETYTLAVTGTRIVWVAVSAQMGLAGDEGTMAEFFARDRWLWFVGERGGLKTPNPDGKGYVTGYKARFTHQKY
jgi:hypothetical protein